MEDFVIPDFPNFPWRNHHNVHEEGQVGVCSCLGNPWEKIELFVPMNLQSFPALPNKAAREKEMLQVLHQS